jgi:ribokinase
MSDMQGSILVVGSANLDFVVRAPHVPAPGETVLGGEFATYPGGKGANQAVAAARAGANTRMLVALGDDAYAEPIEASLREAGVQLAIVRDERPTGTAFIVVADSGENAITVASGANAGLRREHLPNLERVGHLLLQLETPLDVVEACAKAAQAAGVRTILNAAPARQLTTGLLGAVDVLIVNEGELAVLAGDGSLRQRLDALAIDTVVVTLGARGCCARTGQHHLVQPAFPIEAVDTTAAGDTFCGAFAAALAEHGDLAAALRFAAAAAAIACTRAGAQTSIPARAEIDALLRSSATDAQAAMELARACGVAPP